VARSVEAERFGVLVSRKLGQYRPELARRLCADIRRHDRVAYAVLTDTITPAIDYMDFDCFVSTACPRVAIDDGPRYKKPLLTPVELSMALGDRPWEPYVFDQIL
jgi:2-(3-amino-3-carboxypropyl)histidine synthase